MANTQLINVKMKRVKECEKLYLSEMQELADLICESEHHKRIPIDIKDITASKARLSKGTITMSCCWCNESDEARWATVIHEVCHFLEYRDWRKNKPKPKPKKSSYTGEYYMPVRVFHSTTCHGDTFKRYETKWLHTFGLRPVYKRSYWKQLLDLQGGLVWSE